jgi:LPS sulfotransferase NodH
MRAAISDWFNARGITYFMLQYVFLRVHPRLLLAMSIIALASCEKKALNSALQKIGIAGNSAGDI